MADVDSSKLKPCPFCGGKAHAMTADPAVRQPEFIMCLACLAEIEGPGSIEQWNERYRAPTRREVEAYLTGRIAELEVVGHIDSDDDVSGSYAVFKNDCDLRDGTELCRLSDVKAITDERDALLLKVAELELLADDARGKRCPECSAPMVSLSTIDGGQRVCSGCDKVWSWHLKEGQPPLIGNNRMVKKG